MTDGVFDRHNNTSIDREKISEKNAAADHRGGRRFCGKFSELRLIVMLSFYFFILTDQFIG